MSGLKSRRKGMRNEYLLRDYFRSIGWVADRVPSSGAAQGFKGDVKLSKGSMELFAECKVRQSEFKSIYAMVESIGKGQKPVWLINGGISAVVSTNFNDLGYETSVCLDNTVVIKQGHNRAFKKLFNLTKFVKTCNFLVLRINHKPFLFVRFIQ